MSVATTAPTCREPSFLAFVQALDRAEPLDAAGLKRLVGPSLQCTENGVRLDCEMHDLAVGGVRVALVDFRSTPGLNSSILVLGALDGECVPIADIERRFGPSELRRDCVDGPPCLYRVIARPRSRLSAGVADQSARCAASIALDSYR